MIDWDGLVLQPTMAVFGQTVVYTPAGGTAFTLVDAVFDDAYHPLQPIEDGTAMTTELPVLGVRLSEFPTGVTPLQGDSVVITALGITYKVRDVEPDGHGHVKLLLLWFSGP